MPTNQPQPPTPDPRLLKVAIDDRDARPWRYYRYEREDLKRFCEQLADKLHEAEAALSASVPPHSELSEKERKERDELYGLWPRIEADNALNRLDAQPEASPATEERAERVSAMLHRWNDEDRSLPEAAATPTLDEIDDTILEPSYALPKQPPSSAPKDAAATPTPHAFVDDGTGAVCRVCGGWPDDPLHPPPSSAPSSSTFAELTALHAAYRDALATKDAETIRAANEAVWQWAKRAQSQAAPSSSREVHASTREDLLHQLGPLAPVAETVLERMASASREVESIRERWNTDGFNNGPDKRKADGKMRFWCHCCARDADDPRGHEEDCEWIAAKTLLRHLDAQEAELRYPLDRIAAELTKATRKFPTWPCRGIDAVAIVAEESGELQRAALQATYEGGSIEDVEKEAIQTAAMAIQLLLNLPETTFDRVQQIPKRALADLDRLATRMETKG